MPKQEKKRTFESEALILPALKMVLVDSEKVAKKQPVKAVNPKAGKDVSEETVMRIIDKLIAKE
jgi:hypothetical protein